MDPSKILVRNLIDFGLISFLELRGTSKFKCFVGVIVATDVAGATATTVTTLLFC
jgi:hypothetical protein